MPDWSQTSEDLIQGQVTGSVSNKWNAVRNYNRRWPVEFTLDLEYPDPIGMPTAIPVDVVVTWLVGVPLGIAIRIRSRAAYIGSATNTGILRDMRCWYSS